MKKLSIKIFIVLILFSCKSKNTVNLNTHKETSVDTTDRMHFDFQPFFSDKSLVEVDIGILFLPSGKIVAGDPFFVNDQLPFTKTVRPGKYAVKILLSKIEEGHFRVAFAKIVFDTSKAIKWEMALTSNSTQDDIDSLQSGDFIGYGVDAGLGCFTDIETNKIFSDIMDKFYREHPTGNYYSDVLETEFKDASGDKIVSRNAGDWCNHFPNRNSLNNVIMFSSGWGDGYYPTYWGYNNKGEIAELVTDFLVITTED